jgi:serine/threonine-protein kinase
MQAPHEDWQQVLSLLDEALDLPAAHRLQWLERLPSAREHLRPLLRQLLDDRRAIETGDFLAGLPALAGLRVNAEADQADPFAVGDTVGPWTLLRALGQGGMASVWLAQRTDGAHARPVALKLPHPGLGGRGLAQRFARERAILSTLEHPHIAQVLDAGASGAQPWLALEFVDGRPITEHAAALSVQQRLRLFLPVLQAVQHAHERLVLHRDIKPANVLVHPQGGPKLLDFGVAKLMVDEGGADSELTQWGSRALTPQYASPEQLAGQPLGVASDVYALGVLLYEVLCGQRPYTVPAGSGAAQAEAVRGARIPWPSQVARRTGGLDVRALQGDVDTVAMKALAAEPAARYGSAAAMAEDITRHLSHRPIAARPASWAYRTGRLLRRHRLGLGVAAALLVVLSAGVVATLWQADRAQREARNAQATSDFLVDLFSATDLREQTPEAAARITAVQLMDRGQQRLATELADAPEARARLLATLADWRAGAGQMPQSQALLEQSLAAWRSLPGRELEQAQLLVQLSSRALEQDQVDQAEAHAREGLALLQGRRGVAEDRERGNLLARLGDVLYRAPPPQAAAEAAYLEAVDLLARHPVKADEYPAALNGLAWVRMGPGRFKEALELLQTMRSERVARWGQASMMVTAVDRDLVQVARAAGFTQQALQTSTRVLAAMEAGAAAASTELLTTRFGHGLLLEETGQWAACLVQMDLVEQGFQAREDAALTYRAGAGSSAAACLLEMGRTAEALARVDATLALMKRSQDRSQVPSAMPAYARFVRARVLTRLGRYAEAEVLFNPLHAELANDPPVQSRGAAMLWVRHAEMEVQRGDAAAAGRMLDQAQAAIKPESAFHAQVLDHIDASRARVDLLRGQPQAARARLLALQQAQARAAEPRASVTLQMELAGLLQQLGPAAQTPPRR